MGVRFNDLPLAVRERFVHLAKTRPQNAVIAFQSRTGAGWLKYPGALLTGGAAFALSSALVDIGSRVEPFTSRMGYAVLVVVLGLFFAILVSIGFAFKWKKPPYPEGLYAFPGMLVEAKGGDLRIVPIVQAGDPKITHRYYNGGYTGSWVDISGFSFRFGSKNMSQEAARALLNAQQIYGQAWQRGDAQTIQQMDPFHECTLSNNWTAPPEQQGTPPHADIIPPRAEKGKWVVAFGAALVATAVLYLVVDNVFDDDRKSYQEKLHPKPKKKKVVDDD